MPRTTGTRSTCAGRYPWSGGVRGTQLLDAEFVLRPPAADDAAGSPATASRQHIELHVHEEDKKWRILHTTCRQPGEQPGVAGPAITSTLMSAAALGGAGVRLYQFEAPTNLASLLQGTRWYNAADRCQSNRQRPHSKGKLAGDGIRG